MENKTKFKLSERLDGLYLKHCYITWAFGILITFTLIIGSILIKTVDEQGILKRKAFSNPTIIFRNTLLISVFVPGTVLVLRKNKKMIEKIPVICSLTMSIMIAIAKIEDFSRGGENAWLTFIITTLVFSSYITMYCNMPIS